MHPVKSEPYLAETAHGPYLQIIEEPKQRGFRFRYECEGPSHGGLPGASSEKNKKTYPTVKVCNYVGYARVEVQLVTHTDPPRIHAHSLVSKQCNENGTCSMDVGPTDLTAQFNNLGILHITKKGVSRRVDALSALRSCLTDAEEQAIAKEAKALGKDMDLNVVRLKFTAYLQDSDGRFTRALKPVISKPIYDSKSPNASNLKISRMDKTCGSVLGGDEIFLLCDKVQKDDIEIRFFEDGKDGGWEDFGDFSPTDVHKQYAIVFKTPKYHTIDIERPVTVFLQLKRKKGDDCSEPKQFTYVPYVQDKEEVQRKKQKPLPHSFDPWNGPPGGAAGTGRGPGNFGGSGGANASALQNRASQATRQTARALLNYCSTGDVRLLLAVQRQLYSIQDENGDTPLHLAIIHQQPAVVQQLVHMIISISQQNILNIRNHLSQTPLHLAVITKQHGVLDFLLKAGADPTLLDRDGKSVLHLAADVGDEVLLQILLTHLGEHNAHLVNMVDYNGMYPIHLAVRRGGERCLRVLVEGGAQVDAQERKGGSTALHLAVKENLFKLACMLITELKADVNARTFGGNTPLHLAASLGSPTLCSMLIAAGGVLIDKAKTSSATLGIFFSKSCENQRHPRPHPSFFHAAKPQMDNETLSKLCGILSQGNVPLRQLAEKLGMLTLADLYQECPSPCQNLLENYQLAGGHLEGLVEALRSLGLTEGVRLLRQTETRDKSQSTGTVGPALPFSVVLVCVCVCVCVCARVVQQHNDTKTSVTTSRGKMTLSLFVEYLLIR
uniref:Nuclear factor of kappa light polypeptide gene enhancer in B-cells 2 (p49/p100) n=1 Tax=Scleropages formosus TaxID=113540 RepID=A0A8C9T9P0_SCLFO